ncbi:MAG TPA: hypothetical protein VMT66_13740 [Steroidobacteraceae bacterium]|nr:hypothetical protein [Steroidobacteraceae bacterium]
MRALTATWLCALALTRAASTCAANPGTFGSADTQYANYAFASEIGSGVYEISGSVITVYTFEPGYTLRRAEPNGGRPGIRLIFPFTVGFFNFDTKDLIHLELPHSIGALSFEPGVELDYWMNDAWDLYPYVKAGGTAASSSQVNAIIWGAGIRSDYRFDALEGAGLWRSQFNYAGAHYHGEFPDQSFTRLRNGAELRRSLNLTWHSRALQLAPYGIVDVYFTAPSGPDSGIAPRTLQFELGLMLGFSPQWQLFGVSLPRLGIGYRDAGVLSGWRLVLGDPF